MTLLYSRRTWCLAVYPDKNFWLDAGWPFGKLQISNNELKISLFMKKYVIKVSEISYVKLHNEIKERRLYQKTLWPFVEIVHKNKKYKDVKLFFHGRNNLNEILDIFKKLKIDVKL